MIKHGFLISGGVYEQNQNYCSASLVFQLKCLILTYLSAGFSSVIVKFILHKLFQHHSFHTNLVKLMLFSRLHVDL